MSSSFPDGQNLHKKNRDTDDATIRIIHKGHFFTLYLVRIRSRFYVRKQLSEDFKDSELHQNLLRKEFEVGQQLDHPHIVRYVFIIDDETGLYVFIDYLKGDNLQNLLAKEDNVLNKPYIFINQLVADLSSAFKYLHDKGIFHGDVSPTNIIYNKDLKRFFIIDLGFAATDNYIKLGGGTDGFAAPEAFENPDKINATSDIFSFGKVLEQICQKTGTKKYDIAIRKCCTPLQCERYQNFDDVANAFYKAYQLKTWMIASFFAIILLVSSMLFIHLSISPTKTKANPTTPSAPVNNKTKANNSSTANIFGFKPQLKIKQIKFKKNSVGNKEENIIYKKIKVEPIIILKNKIDVLNTKEHPIKNIPTTTYLNYNNTLKNAEKKSTKIIVEKVHDEIWADEIAEKESFVKTYRLLASDTMKARTLNILMNKCMDNAFENYKSFVEKNNFYESDKKLLMNAYYGRSRRDFLEIEQEIHNKYTDEIAKNRNN